MNGDVRNLGLEDNYKKVRGGMGLLGSSGTWHERTNERTLVVDVRGRAEIGPLFYYERVGDGLWAARLVRPYVLLLAYVPGYTGIFCATFARGSHDWMTTWWTSGRHRRLFQLFETWNFVKISYETRCRLWRRTLYNAKLNRRSAHFTRNVRRTNRKHERRNWHHVIYVYCTLRSYTTLMLKTKITARKTRILLNKRRYDHILQNVSVDGDCKMLRNVLILIWTQVSSQRVILGITWASSFHNTWSKQWSQQDNTMQGLMNHAL